MIQAGREGPSFAGVVVGLVADLLPQGAEKLAFLPKLSIHVAYLDGDPK